MKQKQIKSVFDIELKDLNESKGIVEFYFSAWTKDLDGDTILKTAFTKTIKENKSRIYHNRDHIDSVGTPIAFGTDDNGAWVSSQLAIKTIAGADMFEQYKAGLVKGHSQEFEPIRATGIKGIDRVIEEARLWGVTSVTAIPANLDTPTIELKSFEYFSNYVTKISKLLTEGKVSDELGEKFLKEYKSLSEIIEKKNKEREEKSKPKGIDFAYIVNNL